MGYTAGLNSREYKDIFLFSTASRPALRSTQPPLSPGVKRPGREADHSPPSSAEVKNSGVVPPLPHTTSWRGTLIKQRETLPST
jgi:hypothetical protein